MFKNRSGPPGRGLVLLKTRLDGLTFEAPHRARVWLACWRLPANEAHFVLCSSQWVWVPPPACSLWVGKPGVFWNRGPGGGQRTPCSPCSFFFSDGVDLFVSPQKKKKGAPPTRVQIIQTSPVFYPDRLGRGFFLPRGCFFFFFFFCFFFFFLFFFFFFFFFRAAESKMPYDVCSAWFLSLSHFRSTLGFFSNFLLSLWGFPLSWSV